MIELETLRVLLGKLEQGLGQLRAQEAAAMEQRLRQEGAVLAVRQLMEQAEQAGAEPVQEGGDDGGNH